jgi:hypothetical protein
MSDQIVVHPERRKLAAFALGAARTLDISASVYRESRVKSEAEIAQRAQSIREIAARSAVFDSSAFEKLDILRLETSLSHVNESAGAMFKYRQSPLLSLLKRLGLTPRLGVLFVVLRWAAALVRRLFE